MKPEELTKCVEGIGGRFNDLDFLIQKVVAGLPPSVALADMVSRAVSELRKIGLDGNSADWVLKANSDPHTVLACYFLVEQKSRSNL